MELKELVALYRRWLWLVMLGLILGLASGYAVSRIQEPVYEATAKALVTRTRQPGSTDILSISDQQLVLTYQQLLKTQAVLDEVTSRLNTKVAAENVKVDIIADTQIIQLKVQDKNASQAAAIANELVQVLIEQNETLQAGRYTAYEQGLNSQIEQVQEQISTLQSQITKINQANIQEQLDLVNQQITDIQAQIASLEQDIANFPSLLSRVDRASLTGKQSQLNQLRSLLNLYQEIQTNLVFLGKPNQGTGATNPQVTSLQATLNLYQQLYLNLLNNRETVKLARAQSTPTVTKIQEATIPKAPIRPIPVLYTALSGVVGLFIAAGAILLMDYFDDTLKSSEKIEQILGLQVIGQITRVPRKSNHHGRLYLENQAGSMVLNAFESLSINVSYLMEQQPLKSLLVTSPSSGEGKTTISLNLAAAFVRSGYRVVLLDVDFYHPMIHSRLGLNNGRGLSDILTGELDWREAVHDIGGVQIITSGARPASWIRLLKSKAMSELLEKLHAEADLIILDGPPLFIVDSQILASKVGGILLIVRQGATLTAAASSVLNQLKLVKANILGVVLNYIPQGSTYYGYYHYAHVEKPGEKVEAIRSSQGLRDIHSTKQTHIP